MSPLLWVLRWIARLDSLLVTAVFIAVAIAVAADPFAGPPAHWFEWAGRALLTLACMGMLMAWKWELPGALLSLGTLALFLAMLHAAPDKVILVLAAPGALFLLDWSLRRRQLHVHTR